MRPCVEDFIDLVAREFRFDLKREASDVLEDGRERWRRRQIATLVRDAPDEAARVLQELGYDVQSPPSGHPPANTAGLRRP
jgi:hypothetical protein